MGLREKLRQWCPNPENSFFARVKRHSKPVLITTTAVIATAAIVSSILLLQQQAVATFPEKQPFVPGPTPSPSATSTPVPPAPTPTATPIPSLSAMATPAPTSTPTLGGYNKSIIINTDNTEEENALSTAENTNYTSIFKVERFYGYNGTDYYGHYTWAQFIDKEVLNYYEERFERLKGQPRNMTFSYEANVYAWNQIGVVYIPDTYSIHAVSSNGTILFKNANYTGPNFGMRFFCRNDSGYQEIQTGQINFSFSTSYVVEMKLKYSENYAPLAGFMSDVHQIIIVDEHFEPLFLCFQAQKLIS